MIPGHNIPKYNIIVAVDAMNGIGKDGSIPWKSDLQFFKDTTIGNGNNVVIMGRKTYESIPLKHKPLKNRTCIVISRTWDQNDHPDIHISKDLLSSLLYISSNLTYDEIFIAGGEQIYQEALTKLSYLCKSIYMTKFPEIYNCDKFFILNGDINIISQKILNSSDQESLNQKEVKTVQLFTWSEHQETRYLQLLQNVLDAGEVKSDRTGTGTRSVFGTHLSFDISKSIPMLTTRKISFAIGIKELLFFLSGKTDTTILEKQNVNIWKGNTRKSFLEARGLNYKEGDMGPGYGYQWRHFGTEYKGTEADYTGKGTDQIKNIIESLRLNPHSRRHILTAWNPAQLDKMALPPCHILAQFNVSGDGKHLDCMLYQRSADLFLGSPYNMMSYSVLTYIIGHFTGLKPRKFIYNIGDSHIYNNHTEQTEKLLKRTPRPFPSLKLVDMDTVKTVNDLTFDNFVLENYTNWPHISAKMAV